MDLQSNHPPTHGPAPVRSLTPIRRLLAVALISALAAIVVVVSSAFHIMQTTDAAEMERERERAGAVADMLETATDPMTGEDLAQLGLATGLKNFAVSSTARRGPGAQTMPLLWGPMRGQFINWTTAYPGRMLFAQHAPTRLPLAVGAIFGVLLSLLLMLRHMRQIERQRQVAEDQATRDHLTGLPNRLALERHLQSLLASGEGFSVLAMDLDRFKPVNDLFGHHVGDQALRIVAARLQRQMLPEDMLARVGGDEFVAVVQRNTSRTGLAELALDCIHTVSAPMDELGAKISVGISIGIVADGLRHPSGAPLKLADRALYDAKRGQGCTYRFSGDEPIEEITDLRRHAV